MSSVGIDKALVLVGTVIGIDLWERLDMLKEFWTQRGFPGDTVTAKQDRNDILFLYQLQYTIGKHTR